MRPRLLVIGLVVMLIGLFWAAQGAGLIPFPARSPMVGRRAWVLYGLAFAAFGAVMAVLGRRR